MTTEKDVLTRPPEDAPAAKEPCPYCNDTGFYRPANCENDPRFADPEYYAPCPYCNALGSEDEPEITPPEPPYDPQPKASGYELQIFGIISIVGLLTAALIGVIRSITLARQGAIPSLFHNTFAVGWALFALALLLLSIALIWAVKKLKKTR